MDDEWVSREEIHSIARRHMPIDGLNDQLVWVLRDSFFQLFGLWDPVSQKTANRTRNGLQVFAQPEDPAASIV